jgi:hypothetical protein
MARASYSVKIGAGGTGTITIQSGSRETWIVNQVSVELAGAPSGSTCDLRLNNDLVTLLVPQGDAATGDPPVRLLPSDALTINWAGCTAGTVGRALVLYEVERR